MNIINYVRANFFNSSSAAFELLQKKPDKYYDLINKILAVKTDAVEQKMMQKTALPQQIETLLAKQKKYTNLINQVDFIIKKDHLSHNQKYWATPLFTHSATRLNSISKEMVTKKVVSYSNTKMSGECQRSPKSWFNYLMDGDREHGLAFFSQPEERIKPSIMKKVSFSDQENEIIGGSQGEYDDVSYICDDSEWDSDSTYIFPEYDSSDALSIDDWQGLDSNSARNENASYENIKSEHIYAEVPFEPRLPKKSKG